MRKDTTIDEIDDEHLWLENKSWVCQLDDDKDLHLGLLIEATDMREYDISYENKQFPVVLSAEIYVVPEEMDPDYKETCMAACGCSEFSIAEAHAYSGGVHVSDFMEGISGRGKCNVPSRVVKNVHGLRSRLFETTESALTYARKVYASNADTMFLLVGFVLDKQVNMVGNTGWHQIQLHARNEDCWYDAWRKTLNTPK